MQRTRLWASNCFHIKIRQTYIYVFQTLIVPLSLPLSLRLVSLPRSLFRQCDWLGWLGCHGNQIPIRGPHAAAGARKRTAHTGHYGNTPPRGPQRLILPETLVPRFDWAQRPSRWCLRPPLYPALPSALLFLWSGPNFPSLFIPLLFLVLNVCDYLRVHESHLPDQEGRVALFIVARYCEVSVGGAAVWIGPVLVTLHL